MKRKRNNNGNAGRQTDDKRKQKRKQTEQQTEQQTAALDEQTAADVDVVYDTLFDLADVLNKINVKYGVGQMKRWPLLLLCRGGKKICKALNVKRPPRPLTLAAIIATRCRLSVRRVCRALDAIVADGKDTLVNGNGNVVYLTPPDGRTFEALAAQLYADGTNVDKIRERAAALADAGVADGRLSVVPPDDNSATPRWTLDDTLTDADDNDNADGNNNADNNASADNADNADNGNADDNNADNGNKRKRGGRRKR